MKTKKRRIIGLFSLLLALMFLLSACGSSQSTTGGDTNETPEAPAESGSTSAEDAEEPTKDADGAMETETAGGSGRLKMTLNGTDVVYAELTDTTATAEFLEQLPFTVEMHEHLDRQKEVYLPFSLSEESQQDTVYEYEIGDIVYWHPGPTMGIFTEHDGRSISSGIEVLARMDEEGVAAFQAYDDEVEVLFELESGTGASSDTASAQGSRQLTITLDDTDVIYASLLDTPAADAFAEQLPLTLDMTDYANREKHAHLGFTIDDSDLENIQYPYEIGDIIYYPPGPTFAMYYDHDGREISAEDTPAENRTAAADEEEHGADGAGQNAEGAQGSAAEEQTGAEAETGDTNGAGDGKILVAYFSVMETDGVDTVSGASRVAVDGEVYGNNQYIAQIIQQQVGGGLFSIETVQEYPTTHDPLLGFAYEEKSDNARPELATQIENPDSYDVIFLGYPNWNADLPMPLYTFLEEYDFGGKTIIPFTTHGGSGFSRTIQTIAELQPDAEVVSDGLSIPRDSVSGAEDEVINWISGLGLGN